MFVRRKVVKGRTYFQVVESYREGGRVLHRTLASLGGHPTIEEARRAAREHYFALKRTAPDRDSAWVKVLALDVLLMRAQGPGYERDPDIESERRRRRRAAASRRAGQKARKQARDREQEEEVRDWLELESDQTYRDLVALDLMPAAEAIKEARRRKAREFHPDHGGSDDAMSRVNDAYRRLLKRARHRAEDATAPSAGQSGRLTAPPATPRHRRPRA